MEGDNASFHHLQFGHWQMGNGSISQKPYVCSQWELKEERIDLILITVEAAVWKVVDFS